MIASAEEFLYGSFVVIVVCAAIMLVQLLVLLGGFVWFRALRRTRC